MEALLLLLELAEDRGQKVFVCARPAARPVCNKDLDWPTANARVVPLAAKTNTVKVKGHRGTQEVGITRDMAGVRWRWVACKICPVDCGCGGRRGNGDLVCDDDRGRGGQEGRTTSGVGAG